MYMSCVNAVGVSSVLETVAPIVGLHTSKVFVSTSSQREIWVLMSTSIVTMTFVAPKSMSYKLITLHAIQDAGRRASIFKHNQNIAELSPKRICTTNNKTPCLMYMNSQRLTDPSDGILRNATTNRKLFVLDLARGHLVLSDAPAALRACFGRGQLAADFDVRASKRNEHDVMSLVCMWVPLRWSVMCTVWPNPTEREFESCTFALPCGKRSRPCMCTSNGPCMFRIAMQMSALYSNGIEDMRPHGSCAQCFEPITRGMKVSMWCRGIHLTCKSIHEKVCATIQGISCSAAICNLRRHCCYEMPACQILMHAPCLHD